MWRAINIVEEQKGKHTQDILVIIDLYKIQFFYSYVIFRPKKKLKYVFLSLLIISNIEQ